MLGFNLLLPLLEASVRANFKTEFQDLRPVQAFLFAKAILRLDLIVAKNKVIEGFRSCTIMNCRLNCLKKENCIDETGSKTNKKNQLFPLEGKKFGRLTLFQAALTVV